MDFYAGSDLSSLPLSTTEAKGSSLGVTAGASERVRYRGFNDRLSYFHCGFRNRSFYNWFCYRFFYNGFSNGLLQQVQFQWTSRQLLLPEVLQQEVLLE